MIKFYIPDGHLEEEVLNLFRKAGFVIETKPNNFIPFVDDKEIFLKKIRPQDVPFVISIGKGDVAITGSDIMKEFALANPKNAEKIKKLMDLPINKTKLVLAISRETFPKIKNISQFLKHLKNQQKNDNIMIIASEYPNIAKEYLKEKNIKAVIREPAGKTEAWILPPNPEADMIIDTVETGATLGTNNCLELDTVYESTPLLIVNKKSFESKKKKILELIQLFEGVLYAKDMVNVWMNVTNPNNLSKVINVLSNYVSKPTISELKDGGYDIFIIIKKRFLRDILPQLIKAGASGIAVTDTKMLIKGKEDERKT